MRGSIFAATGEYFVVLKSPTATTGRPSRTLSIRLIISRHWAFLTFFTFGSRWVVVNRNSAPLTRERSTAQPRCDGLWLATCAWYFSLPCLTSVSVAVL